MRSQGGGGVDFHVCFCGPQPCAQQAAADRRRGQEDQASAHLPTCSPRRSLPSGQLRNLLGSNVNKVPGSPLLLQALSARICMQVTILAEHHNILKQVMLLSCVEYIAADTAYFLGHISHIFSRLIGCSAPMSPLRNDLASI